MRFDTHRISAHLVNELQKGRPRLEVTYDGGDLIRVSLESNETVHIYLIENPITVYEIRGMVAANTAIGVYTLFILWRDLFLPVHGARYRPNDWMEALLTLHRDKIYAFDAYYDEEFYIFPVYFEGAGVERLIRHGTAIDPMKLVGEMISITAPLIAGVWRIANFEASEGETHEADTRPVVTAMTIYFQWLSISATDSRKAVKRAYRRLARKYHPDLNDDPGATVRMQQINEAYQRILEDMDQRGIDDDDPEFADDDHDDPRYRRAARLLAQKLGVDWHDLPTEQVIEYLRKIEIARRAAQAASPPPKLDDET